MQKYTKDISISSVFFEGERRRRNFQKTFLDRVLSDSLTGLESTSKTNIALIIVVRVL